MMAILAALLVCVAVGWLVGWLLARPQQQQAARSACRSLGWPGYAAVDMGRPVAGSIGLIFSIR